MSRVVRGFIGAVAGGAVGWSVAALSDALQLHHIAGIPDDLAQFGIIGIGAFNGLAVGLWGWWKTIRMMNDDWDESPSGESISGKQSGATPPAPPC